MSGFGAPLFITRHVLIALVVGGLGGVLLMAFLIEFDHFTSSNAFCTSCHSMNYAEESYRQTAHYDSASGVRATCGDCHVSAGLLAATWDHAVGIKDLIKQFLGPDYDDPVINTLHLPEAAFAARDLVSPARFGHLFKVPHSGGDFRQARRHGGDSSRGDRGQDLHRLSLQPGPSQGAG